MESEGWSYWEGKKVFIILKNHRQYSGIVQRVDISPPLVWITILDKFNNRITFSAEEIEVMQEEE